MLMALLAGAGESAAHGAAGKAPFPPFESWHMPGQLFWLAIMFSGLYLALSRFILPKLGDTIEKRSDRIAADLDQAARLNDQAHEAERALEVSLSAARTRARETSEKARERMQSEMTAESARLDADIEKKLAAADTRISNLRETAMANVEQIATDAAETILYKLGADASKADLKAAIKAARGNP